LGRSESLPFPSFHRLPSLTSLLFLYFSSLRSFLLNLWMCECNISTTRPSLSLLTFSFAPSPQAPEVSTPSTLSSFFKKKKKNGSEVNPADRLEMAINDSSHPSVHSSILAVGHKKTGERRAVREETRRVFLSFLLDGLQI